MNNPQQQSTSVSPVEDIFRQIAQLDPEPVILGTGEAISVYVCTGRTLPKVLLLMATVSKELGLSFARPEELSAALLEQVMDVSNTLQLIAEHTEEVYELIAACTSLKDKDAVADLDVEALMLVAGRVAEVNRSFFIQKVIPAFKALYVRLGKNRKG